LMMTMSSRLIKFDITYILYGIHKFPRARVGCLAPRCTLDLQLHANFIGVEYWY
jgi:hypothetical protein